MFSLSRLTDSVQSLNIYELSDKLWNILMSVLKQIMNIKMWSVQCPHVIKTN